MCQTTGPDPLYEAYVTQQEPMAFEDWIQELDEAVIQGEFGYESGEFTVYPSEWRALFDEGLTPRQAWQRALDALAAERRPLCSAIPIVADREANCREPWHWDDGVPYCDKCGLFRDTVARQEASRSYHA